MNTQHTPQHVVTYEILINEQQRSILRNALLAYLAAGVGDMGEDEFCANIAASLEDMLNPNGSVGPLQANGIINSFVL